MIVLHPVVLDGKRVPGLFEELGTREPMFTEHLLDGKLIYSHESGYGYLPADQVCIMEHV